MSSTMTSNSTVSVTKKVFWEVPNVSRSESRSAFAEYETGKQLISKNVSILSDNASGNGKDMITEWYFGLCPNGYIEKYKSKVGIYLHCNNAKDAGFEFKAKYKFGLQKANGQDGFILAEEYTRLDTRSKKELKRSHGDHKFVSHEQLFNEENGYVVGGKLVVFVELTIEAEIAKPPPKIARCSTPFADFKKMLEYEAFSDFQLKTSDNEILKAHKVVLDGRSPVFFAMLTTDMEEVKKGSVSVPDFDSKVMKEVLRFIYCNEVQSLSEIAPELIYAAEKNQLEELKDICLQEIISSVRVENVIKILTIAYRLSDAEELFEKCLDLIANNFCKVSQCLSLEGLPNELMLKIIGRLCVQRNTLRI